MALAVPLVSAIPAQASATGAIAGTVTDRFGNPVNALCVRGLYSIGWAYTDNQGRYLISDIEPGTYVVSFNDETILGCSTNEYVPEFFDDRPGRDSADLVTVVDGQTAGPVDAILERTTGLGAGPPSISGTVRSESGQPLADVCVQATGPATAAGPPPGRHGTTDALGRYSITGLDATGYSVRFRDCAHNRYLPTQWGDPSNFWGEQVHVGPGQEVTGIDAVLELFDVEIARRRGSTTDRTPTFHFSSPMRGATFACRVDARPARSCTSPLTLKRQRRGRHTFSVAAFGEGGNMSAPDTERFRIRRKRR